MSISKKVISDWFDRGVAQGATRLLVVCDTFEYDDYPVYANTDETFMDLYKAYHGKNMQRVMEVYDLKGDKEAQLKEYRAYHVPTKRDDRRDADRHPPMII